MKMVRAVIRPEKEAPVASALARNGFPAMTKWDVLGRGKQQGIQVGSQFYDELAKSMIMVVVEDEQAEAVAEVIRENAITGYPGDGKTFITEVETVYTIRTGLSSL